MRWFLALLLLLAGGAPAAEDCPASPVPPLGAAMLAARLAAGQPATIVAFGSSSTQGSGASGPGATYPAQLQEMLRAALPGARLRVLNRGIGGQDAPEMLARIEAEVIAERPVLVIWQVGANGALRRSDPEAFRALVAMGLAQLRAGGAEVILMDNQRAPAIAATPNHAAFDAVLRDLARSPGVSLFSRGRLMDDWASAGVPAAAMLVPDGLHHNDRGYRCLAAALADGILRAVPARGL